MTVPAAAVPGFLLALSVLVSADALAAKSAVFATDEGAIRGYDPVACFTRGEPMLLAGMVPTSTGAGIDRVPVLEDGNLEGWKERSFVGHTSYEPVTMAGRRVLHAVSRGSASGWFREMRIDLTRTPVLHWRWRVEQTLGDIDETTKSGDDYAARIYVIDESVLFWRTRAVNYVWASAQPAGASWENAYAGDNAFMVAVRSGDARAGEWIEESRDVRADFRALYGEAIDRVDGIAIMTDTDDTNGAAQAWYGDIWFAAQ